MGRLDKALREMTAIPISSEPVTVSEQVGFERAAHLPGFARDRNNAPRDLVALADDLSTASQPETHFFSGGVPC